MLTVGTYGYSKGLYLQFMCCKIKWNDIFSDDLYETAER